MRFDRVTIINIRLPQRVDINTELQWFGGALGLFGDRDKDSSCFRIFVTLVKASRNNNALSSDEIAHHTALTRGTVVHHLNKLQDAGLVTHEHLRYHLVGHSVQAALANLQAEINDAFTILGAVARDIDQKIM